MRLARREFVKLLGIAVGATTTGTLLRSPISWARPSADDWPTLAALALDQVTALGCDYADVRLDRCRRDGGVIESECCVVRVIHAGSWGVALSTSLDEREVARTSARALAAARTHAALGTDAFDVFRQCKHVPSTASCRTEEMYFTSTKGGHSRSLRRFAQREEG